MKIIITIFVLFFLSSAYAGDRDLYICKTEQNFDTTLLGSKNYPSESFKFEWIENVKFELIDSLVFVKDGELTLDGKLIINIQDINQIYKFFVTQKIYKSD